MAQYNIVIIGTVNSDDPTLSYLAKDGSLFETEDDVSKYVETMMADELAIELTEIRVEKKFQK